MGVTLWDLLNGDAYGVCMVSGLQMQIIWGLLAIYFAVAKADGRNEMGLDLFGTGFVDTSFKHTNLGPVKRLGTMRMFGNCTRVIM